MALTDRQQKLLDLLKANGGWMRQQDLARALGKDRLSLEDATALDRLADHGLVIMEIADDLAPGGETVRYRFSQPKVRT
ncbi:MAG: hypothetical protein HZC41_06380 [Chloroflexi bacterium]|nr:hypothetical protein [Chloroflexota bacterium]